MLASAVTLAVLPTIWLINRSDDTASPSATGGPSAATAAATTTTSEPDHMGSLPPRYLNGTSGSIPQPTTASVAVGREETTVIATGSATYRRDVANPGLCLTDLIERGVTVIVINTDNGRSIQCTTQPLTEVDVGAGDEGDGDGADEGELAAAVANVVLLTADFAQLADVTDAPVPVELRQ